MALAGISYWLIGAPHSRISFHLQAFGIWIGLATALAAAALLMSWRFWYLTRQG